jgi:aconitate hydratase
VIANMAPEYGASSGYFAIDHRSCEYLRTTGRPEAHVQLVERASAAIGIEFDPAVSPVYTRSIEIDLAMVTTSLAGPQRPQDRVETANVRSTLERAAGRPLLAAKPNEVPDGAVAIAAITSCTNTSSPQLLIAAGLLAREARIRGLRPASWVKTSLAPGSPSARNLLARAELLEDLETIGFSIVGHGCTTCIGNSGPLTPQIEQALQQKKLAVAVLSGNRNFPGRVHPDLMYGFLVSPPLVVAYALAGDARRDVFTEPIGHDRSGKPVLLWELWPSRAAIEDCLKKALRTEDYRDAFQNAERSERWAALPAPGSVRFPWDENSTYLRPPPFARASGNRLGRYLAHPLMLLDDDITTDHISPAGQIPASSPAAAHLLARGENPNSLNVFAARRGNWEVMLRGLFTNRGVVNRLAEAIPAGCTVHAPSGEVLPIFAAAQRYASDGKSVVIIAGERYGAGSSRDWAAKGPALLGVRAVLAKSFERIHRTNLIGMGILPIRLPAHADVSLRPEDLIAIDVSEEAVVPRGEIDASIHRQGAGVSVIRCLLDVQTNQEIELLIAGGVLASLRAKATA